MSNPTNFNAWLQQPVYGDRAMAKPKPGAASTSIGGSGTIGVHWMNHGGEVPGSAQVITVSQEVGLMGLPGLVVPLTPIHPQTDLAVNQGDPLAMWIEIVALTGTLTWGRYGSTSDSDGTGRYLKSTASDGHLTYTLPVGTSLRIGPCPDPDLGVNGAIDVEDISTVQVGLTSATARNGTIAVGGTAQDAMAANTLRQGGFIYNPITATQQGIAAAESLFVSEAGTANVNTSVEIKPGGMFQIGSTNAISVIGATTNHAWSGEER